MYIVLLFFNWYYLYGIFFYFSGNARYVNFIMLHSTHRVIEIDILNKSIIYNHKYLNYLLI